MGYSAVGTARSALSSFITVEGVKLGSHPLVSRFMSGLFNIKPALPRYISTWDPQQVLLHLKNFPNTKELSLKLLTHKLVMIMIPITAQRTQTLQLLSLDNMNVRQNEISFNITSCLKQTRSGGRRNRHLVPIAFKRYPLDEKLCVFTLLNVYIERTASLRKDTRQLLICHAKPHGPASRDSISRWIKHTMKAAGIDINIFKTHSTRSASTSAAKAADVPIEDIMSTAGWSSESVFAQYYDRPVVKQNTFAEAVLTGPNAHVQA